MERFQSSIVHKYSKSGIFMQTHVDFVKNSEGFCQEFGGSAKTAPVSEKTTAVLKKSAAVFGKTAPVF